VISVTISSPETSYVYYTRMPSPIYQYVIYLVICIWKCKNYNFTPGVVLTKRLEIPYTFSA